MSNLDDLIKRNVAGKNGGPVFYPGEPDPMAKLFDTRAHELFGKEKLEVLASAESVLLSYFVDLYKRSENAPARKLSSNPKTNDWLISSFDKNPSIASPLFLATRHLLRDLYSRVDLKEPVLELGMGAGDTMKAVLDDRKISVGTTPIIDEIRSAEHNYRNHRIYLSADAAEIPFADGTFNTVVMNYTFYHLEDAAAACREVFRVLAPGGHFYFNLVERDAVESTRVLPRMIEGLGLLDFAKMSRDFVFTDYGAEDLAASKQRALSDLGQAGFNEINAVDYLSKPLSKLIWFTRDFQILFMLDLQRALVNSGVENAYREFILEQIAPLLTHDDQLCATEGGTYLFFDAKKPGAGPSSNFSDEEIIDRMRCPRTKQSLERHKNYLVSTGNGMAYPIYMGLPLLVPVYAELWREQNKHVSSKEDWKPFAY